MRQDDMSITNLARTTEDIAPLPEQSPSLVHPLIPLIGDSRELASIRAWFHADAARARVVGIIGEAGTGKTLVARHWHHHTGHADAPCEVIDLRGLPAEVIETELFGYLSAGFFSRREVAPGRIVPLGSGTAIIQGFETLPATIQERCLPWLIEGQIRPVGIHEPVQTTARVVIEVRGRTFSPKRNTHLIRPICELLEPVACEIESLHKRREDVLPIAEYYLHRYADEWGFPRAHFAHDVVKLLKRAPWPENVRSVIVAVASAIHEARGEEIFAKHLPPSVLGRPTDVMASGIDAISLEDIVMDKLERFFSRLGKYDVQDMYDTVMEKVERPLFKLVLSQVEGNQVRAARMLGINRNTLRARLKKLGIKPTGK